MAAALAVEIKN